VEELVGHGRGQSWPEVRVGGAGRRWPGLGVAGKLALGAALTWAEREMRRERARVSQLERERERERESNR